jgi:multidrug efflux pump subunit AcrA (membrane-fusion protein)
MDVYTPSETDPETNTGTSPDTTEPSSDPASGSSQAGQEGSNPTGNNPGSGYPRPSGNYGDLDFDINDYISGMGGISGMGSGSSMPSGGGGGTGGVNYSGSSANTESRYSMNRTTILSVTPQETVTVSITIDELDILDVHKGQEASVTLDALHGQVFTGVITEVNKNASNSGGHSKYSAVVELKRLPNMLGGMNASVSITTENLEDILVVPAEALDELDGQTIVYTAYDTHTEKPGSPVEVKTGLSDGISVQILSGLSAGDTVWYEYFEAEDETVPSPPGFLNW